MKIKYYNFESHRGYSCGYYSEDENSWFNKNYISKELALLAAEKNFVPDCEVSSISLTYPIITGIKKQTEVIYSSKMDKKTRGYKAIGTKEVDVTVEKFNYSIYNRTLDEFKKINSEYYTDKQNNKGFYRLKFGDLILEKNENQIKYKKQVFIKFFAAEIKKTPEIKKPGEPYQEAKEEIIEEEKSDWMPVYFNKGYSGWFSREDNSYSLEKRRDDSEIYYITTIIDLTENSIDILESLD